MLSNAYFLAKFRFDTAENEPAKNLQKLATCLQNVANFANRSPPAPGGRCGGTARPPRGRGTRASAGPRALRRLESTFCTAQTTSQQQIVKGFRCFPPIYLLFQQKSKCAVNFQKRLLNVGGISRLFPESAKTCRDLQKTGEILR